MAIRAGAEAKKDEFPKTGNPSTQRRDGLFGDGCPSPTGTKE